MLMQSNMQRLCINYYPMESGHVCIYLYLGWMHASESVANALHSSDSHASHTAQWSQAGIDCHVMD